MNSPQRYIEPTAGMRSKLLLSVLAVFAVGMLFDRWVSPKLAWVASLPTCESLPWVRLELIAGVAASWYIAFIAYKHGRETMRLGQTPLPGTWVWARTEVRTGAIARFNAYVALTISAVFFVGPVAIAVWQELYLVFCFPQSCGC